jgi:Tol biopolymer transport system component
VFTPDGQDLIYQLNKSGKRDIFKVSVTGGSPVKIADKTWSISISPDGLSRASFRNVYDGEDRIKGAELAVSRADGSEERVLQRTLNGKDDSIVCTIPIWSPDSKRVACAFEHDDLYQIHAINVADGSTKPVGDQKWANPGGGVWMPDNTLVVLASVKSNEPAQLWRVSESEARQVTFDAIGYSGLSATRDGKTLVTVQKKQRSNLWISPGTDPSRAVQVTTSGEVRNFYPLRDGRIAFSSELTDPVQLWLFDRDGNNRRQLTFGDTRVGGPTATPDGRYIIYGLFRGDGFHTHRMNIDGTDAREISSVPAKCPKVSLDSKWAYCYSATQENDLNTIYKIPIDGGPPITLARVEVRDAIDFSPRGDRIASLTTNSELEPSAIKILDINGKLIRSIPVPATVINNDVSIKFTPDGRGIAFVDIKNGAANIWTVSVDGSGRPRPFTNLTAPGIVTFKWPYEGKELFMLRRESTSDAMMITNSRN